MFLYPTISRHFKYDRIPRSLEIEATLIDLGTFISQDLHEFVLDGAPSTDMYGLDTVNHWGLGFDMLRDHEKFHAHCIEGDILIRVRKNETENVYHLGDLRFTSMDMVWTGKGSQDFGRPFESRNMGGRIPSWGEPDILPEKNRVGEGR